MFKMKSVFEDKKTLTKRIVLKQLASCFDPLGFASPILLRGKVFLQHLWNKKVNWDEPLDGEDQHVWQQIKEDITTMSDIEIPRNIALPWCEGMEYRLLCFCDSSAKAYAAVIYLYQSNGQQTKVDLIFSKTRLAPVKKLSIPRLELLAVVIGIRCLAFIREQIHLPITHSHIWSDSQCVLHWIFSEKPLNVFIGNRVKEIRDMSAVSFAYVPTKENPADVASRGSTVSNLCQNQVWWTGPVWLQKGIWDWPTFENQLDASEKEHFEAELRNSKHEPTLVLHSTRSGNETDPEISTTSPFEIKSKYFSSVSRLLRVTAWAIRFVNKLQRKEVTGGGIGAEDIKQAELLWLKYVQEKEYKHVFDAIKEGKQTGIQKQLGLYIDENGILRCKGRLENATLSESARLPILLPNGDWFTHLVIERVHKELLHSGVSQTLAATRMRFWIPKGRSTVKRVVNTCTVCRRYEGGSYKMPPLCSYPKTRVSESKPFSRVGLDYLGPLHIKTENGSSKVWICLFTCLVTRAIHLELVCDMSTDEFLMCFKRFISIRGTPSEIISDNAMQFRTASDILGRVWGQIHKEEEIASYISNKGIKWKFNVELAPWMGGFYERLIALVKRSMKKTIGRRLFTLIQMQTLIKEIESVINTRPLVYVGDDINSSIPLSPAHFLTLNPTLGIPVMDISNDPDYLPVISYAEKLIKIWKRGQELLDMFWKIWRHEYLTSLRERTQTKLRDGRVHSHSSPKVNDVVLIKEDSARGNWRFGKVIQLVQSRDGLVRSVRVMLPSGREIGRPINLLYPMELSGEAEA